MVLNMKKITPCLLNLDSPNYLELGLSAPLENALSWNPTLQERLKPD